MLPRAHRAASNIRRVEVGEVAWIATDLVPSVPTLGGVGGVGAPGHPGFFPLCESSDPIKARARECPA